MESARALVDSHTHLTDQVLTRRSRMTRPVPMEPTAETAVSIVVRSIGQDEPQDSTEHEPKHSTFFEGVHPCVAGAPGNDRAPGSSVLLGYHHDCGQFSTEDRASETSLSQSCHRECAKGSAESADRGAVNSDGVQIQMTAEAETERLDDVGVIELLDDTPPHLQANAAWCLSSASQQHNLDAESKVCSACSEMSDCVMSMFQ